MNYLFIKKELLFNSFLSYKNSINLNFLILSQIPNNCSKEKVHSDNRKRE